MHRFAIRLLASAAFAATLLLAADAQACRSYQGQRDLVTYGLNINKFAEFTGMRFAPKAKLFVGEGAATDVKGIVAPQADYALQVKLDPKGWTFKLRGANGSAGTLRLARPANMDSFVVDPRDDSREGGPDGQGPVLYKEWRVTARARGTGAFAPGAGRGQRITLIVHGRGNACTNSRDFSHWTLEIRGDAAEYSLFGALVRAGYPPPAE
jgi:hypothetical protein